VEGPRIAREGARVLHGGRAVGRVTSGTFAPTLNRVVAMAYVEPAATAAGTPLEVDIRGKPAPAKVVPLPFYRRPRG
jgi:aminomethyltransferase